MASRTRNKRQRHRSLAAVLLALPLIMILYAVPKSQATKLPKDLASNLKSKFDKCTIRLDGAIQTAQGDLYLPLIPPSAKKKSETSDAFKLKQFPEQGQADAIFFANGWCFLRVLKAGKISTLPLLNGLPSDMVKRILLCHFPSDLIVPDQFVLPKSFRRVAKDVSLAFMEEQSITQSNSRSAKTSKTDSNEPGIICVTSPGSGKITILDEKTWNKIIEFPTEGTPGCMAVIEDKLYIADQAKHRVLVLDPQKQQFTGQFDLPLRSAPRGIVASPNGKVLYVSEYGSNCVDIIEVATGKVLWRMKVPVGPSRMAITPDGKYVLAVNVPAGKVTIISTSNKKVLAAVSTGSLPNAIVINKDGTLAYVANRISNTISIIDIDAGRLVATLATGLGPTALALNKDDAQLFVANAKDNTIWVFDTQKRQKTAEVKLPLDVDFPGSMMLMPDGKSLIVSSESTDAIGVFNIAALKFDCQPVIGHPSDEIIHMQY